MKPQNAFTFNVNKT